MKHFALFGLVLQWKGHWQPPRSTQNYRASKSLHLVPVYDSAPVLPRPGQSGMGRYHGKHTFDQLSHQRACMIRNLNMESVNLPRYPPQNRRRARRVRLALSSPLIDMSKRTLVWAVVATILGLGLLITLVVILLIASGLNCTCWYWRGFYN